MSRYRLNWYELEHHESGDWFVKLPLCDVYSKLIDAAFFGIGSHWMARGNQDDLLHVLEERYST